MSGRGFDIVILHPITALKRMLHKQRLVTSQLPVASRRWHFGTKNMLSRRYASGPRALSSDEERELDKATANRAVSSPFFVKGTQHLREPLKLFLSRLQARIIMAAGVAPLLMRNPLRLEQMGCKRTPCKRSSRWAQRA